MNRIEQLRKEQHWYQRELARILHISPQAISNYETEAREMDVPTIRKLCAVFGVSADYLLGLSELRGAELDDEEQALVRRWRALDAQGRAYLLQSLSLVEIANAQKK